MPDDLWNTSRTGVVLPYSRNQAEDMIAEDRIMTVFGASTDHFAAFVAGEGKVEPDEHRTHRWTSAKLKSRVLRMKVGRPPAGSSPAEQQRLGLNEDAGLSGTASESEKLRR